MVQPVRQPASVPQQARLAPAPLAPAAFDPQGINRQLVKALQNISRNGGMITADAPPKRYGLQGGTHVNVSQTLVENLWRWKLPATARDILDHMAATHDEDGVVKVSQKALGEHFECSQSKISRSIGVLSKHHFVWKAARRGCYQLNPTYAYRFGSRKHHALLARLGEDVLNAHTIVVPLPEKRSR
ncbi:hypothetical protein [Streptomyces sp. NPDC089799]|uniref:hypothetical protein n=1 Tax=Streptomyces sp. NPDC089799 TaxID=3155066 RepID=UPI003441E634